MYKFSHGIESTFRNRQDVLYGAAHGVSTLKTNFGAQSLSVVVPRSMCHKLGAGGKPSTWFPPGRLVEHSICTHYQLRYFQRFRGPRSSSVFGNPLRSLLPSPSDEQIQKPVFNETATNGIFERNFGLS